MRLVSQRVQARIVDGVARTTIEQIHRNDGQGEGEAVVLFPIPPDAAVDRFTMTMDGKEVSAEVLPADKARSVYEEIVRKRRDPGLLEVRGSRARARAALPDPAGEGHAGDPAVRIGHSGVGWIHTWSFPLRAAGVGSPPPNRSR